MLFYLDTNNTTCLHPDAIHLCPELSVLEDKEVLIVVLAYDYKSPFRQFTEPDRKRKALIHVYGNDDRDLFQRDKIKQAVEAYNSLQEISRIIKSINAIRESIRDLETEVYDEVAKEGKIVGGRDLSFLEKWQRNKDRYKALMKNKKK
jgi:hypothetical protein